MKKVETIIRKSKFSMVKKALHEVGVNFFSYWDVSGVGVEKVDNDVLSNGTVTISDIERCFLSIIVNDDFEEVTIKAILESASSGKIGDGILIVSSIDEVYRIRTGEKGSNILR
ncbi:P-II family nitrogen regulator [Lacinutrix sp. C3R15]|uniref:P-II family nitrogen regulator n=1 Tax=Flavobacteriaceae TaxID=49546 RepID=UPI001C098DEC|nr:MULTISPECIES: P-II family nitrogen regulator [Flavobacteriaceae]MBU2939948.1 P-II family nitrogen regulator [Lacinutrix sp. C3R15]MDO6623265.1 P-II family nitrogen regulator [Oceanihabitans sp. 1_MG-2023]